ncbi:MAG: hypothetical protein D6E12_05125 [Desulfovibrio sp.]|nr:MAG: hypothetical protein D6E12_05125 [Desulfovibrio sp.]
MLGKGLNAGLFALLLLVSGQTLAAEPSWQDFKAQFLSHDGRIVDPFQDNMSHSEGQGYAMLLAVAHDDRVAFDLIWQWTRDNLQVRSADSLLAWSFGQRLPGQWRVMDFNNATDGDILVAFALLKAWEEWGHGGYHEEALRMIVDIRQLLVMEQQGRLCLLPGYFGFHDGTTVLHNPSYVVYPALDYFARIDDMSFWTQLKKDSQAILAQAMPGDPALPSDWIVLERGAVAGTHAGEASQGFESVRVILYLAWAGELSVLPGLDGLLETASTHGTLPIATANGTDTLAMESIPAGFYAVLARAARDLGRNAAADALATLSKDGATRDEMNYYSQVLVLLAGTTFE